MILDIVVILVCAALNRLGGSVNKNWRRWGIGLALATYGLFKGVQWYWCLPVIPASNLFRCPISLSKDGNIQAHWYNWPWLFVCGFIYGLVPFPLCMPHWVMGLSFAGIFSLIFGLIVALSNIKATANIFKWQYVEYLYGAMIAALAIVFSRQKDKKQ